MFFFYFSFCQIEEKNVYLQRQSVLKEIETLRNRDNELRMRMEAFEKWELFLSFFFSLFMLVKRCYALSLWPLVHRECYCVRMMVGLAKFTRRKSRALKSCWGGENWQWRLWRTHTTKGWRMTFLGILSLICTVSFGLYCHHNLDIFSWLQTCSLI